MDRLWPVAPNRTNFKAELYRLFTDAGRLWVAIDLAGLVENGRDKCTAIERLSCTLGERVRITFLSRMIAMTLGSPSKRAEVRSAGPGRQLAEQQERDSADPNRHESREPFSAVFSDLFHRLKPGLSIAPLFSSSNEYNVHSFCFNSFSLCLSTSTDVKTAARTSKSVSRSMKSRSKSVKTAAARWKSSGRSPDFSSREQAGT